MPGSISYMIYDIFVILPLSRIYVYGFLYFAHGYRINVKGSFELNEVLRLSGYIYE